MLGALAGVSGIVDSENIAEAIRYMPAKLQEKNIKAALAAVDLVSGVAK